MFIRRNITEMYKQSSEDFFKKIYLSLYCKVCVWEGVGDRTELQYTDPHSYGHQRCVFLVLLVCSTGGPEAQLSAGWWLSLPQLVTNFSGPQLTWGSWRPLLPGGGFPYHTCLRLLWSPTHRLPVFTELYNRSIAHSLSPHNLPSEMCHFCCLWDSMFDCHRAEITVMQFRGHSLPVHQSMSVLWAFTFYVSQIRLRDFFS